MGKAKETICQEADRGVKMKEPLRSFILRSNTDRQTLY